MTLKVETGQNIARPLEDVFAAWVDPEQMAGYFISSGTGPMEAGTQVVWSWADHGDMQLAIDVGTVEPSQRLSFEWPATGQPTRVDVVFLAEEDGTTSVQVTETGWPADQEGIAHYSQQLQGWVHMLMCLKAYLEYQGVNLRESPVGSYDLEIALMMEATPDRLYDAWTMGWEDWFADAGSLRMAESPESPFFFEAGPASGRRFGHYGRFLDAEPDAMVEHTWVTEATRGVETRVRVTFDHSPAGTTVHLRHTGFADAASRNAHREGWEGALQHLDACIKEAGH
jgi:uncharacterized protein YndB with AHSA1/START domain